MLTESGDYVQKQRLNNGRAGMVSDTLAYLFGAHASCQQIPSRNEDNKEPTELMQASHHM
jgi:hypothetical protein